jgi:folate-binding protein YgfZ
MLNSDDGRLAARRLSDLGAVRVQGPDAVRFLQGQVSNDVSLLTAENSMLAGLHNPQGRVIALLQLFWIGADDVLAVLPRELATAVAARLTKYVLRAKVKVSDASDEWSAFGLRATGSAADAHERIASGIPQVYAATSEQFVSQMLNLDLLNAISFTKGCYTGQEVIARAHYRGRVKRRMQRFRTLAPARLAIGETGRLRDGRAFRVVDEVSAEDGRCEFLAVATMVAGEDDGEGTANPTPSLDVETLQLPYTLPA